MRGAHSPQILVVDDTPANLKLLSEILSRNGYQVRPASSGALALKSVAIEKPNLILLDVKMPDMDGYEVCRRLKADESNSKIPIIFISALDEAADKVEAFSSGGVDYMTKPFQTEEVLARIRNHLTLALLQEQLESRNARLEKEIEKRARVETSLRTEVLERKRTEKLLEKKNVELENAYAELKKAQMRFIQQEKLVGIGQLAAGVAHEINNPLGFVNSNCESLAQYMEVINDLIDHYHSFKDNIKIQAVGTEQAIGDIEQFEKQKRVTDIREDIDDLVAESKDGLSRISKIVTSLRTFAWNDNQNQFAGFDLNQGIENALVLAHNEIKHYVYVTQELEKLPLIQAIGGYINQVLLNLILNAAQAVKSKKMEELGQIKIKSWQSDDFVFCSMSDNGVGISPNDCKRIFEAFFTTKPVGSGTGLGLSISYDIIVNKHGGDIWVESEEGIGSVVTFKLPVLGGHKVGDVK